MKHILTFYISLILINGCSSQPQIDTKLLFKHPMYEKGCRISTPDFYINSEYYFFSNNNMYSPSPNTWCGEKQNSRRMALPERDYNDYRILNDSIAVFSLINSYDLLYFINFKSGRLVKLDTVIKSTIYSKKIGSKEYKPSLYNFSGGCFVSDKSYYLSAQNNKTGQQILFRIDLNRGVVDSIKTTFILENYLHTIKSSNKYIVTDAGDFGVFNLLVNEYTRITDNNISEEVKAKLAYKVLKSELDSRYKLLDFINDEVIVLHHSKEPHKFALLNVASGKSEVFELDHAIFRLENIREEEVLKVEDGPSDGLNKLKFRYTTCRIGKNQILLSFADRQDNRIAYSLSFGQDILKKLN